MGEPNPELELELERRFRDEDAKQQVQLDALEHRIDEVERWKAAQEAVSSARKWALPLMLSVGGSAMMLINLYVLLTHKH